MTVVICLLSGVIIFLILYIVSLRRQLHSINRQLEKRLYKKSKSGINLSLFNKDLNKLCSNINLCLKKEENLRQENTSKEKQFRDLIADISHDLRTPLTAIKGYQQLLKNEKLSEGQYKKLAIAQKHANDLGELIESFFEYAYLSSKQPELNIERINLTSLVTECIIESIPIFEEKNLMIHLEENPAVFVNGDKKFIVRAVQNLIRNCIDHSDGNITVEVKALEHGELIFRNPTKSETTIDIQQLFDRHYTADSARRKGTGLGLSIVSLLIQQQKGEIAATLHDGILEVIIKLPIS